jgi:formate dehydrogenase iron-sulfur subunit
MSEPVYPAPVPRRAIELGGASLLESGLPDEAELTAGVRVQPGQTLGFFTDTSLCIGCKACEVACKEWNVLPADVIGLTGHSYDNTGALSSTTWRHVSFVEHVDGATSMPPFQSNWLMMSDVCKHCARAACLEACPTGALFRTEFGTVVVQQDICNGCGYCVPACPFGVVDLDLLDGRAHKCTLCYDRLKGGLEPACAKSCPTNSIQFGPLDELHTRARQRVRDLHARGATTAYLYGVEDTTDTVAASHPAGDGASHATGASAGHAAGGDVRHAAGDNVRRASDGGTPPGQRAGDGDAARVPGRASTVTDGGGRHADGHRAGAPGTTGGVGNLHAFFLLLDQPEVYNLPAAPTLPSRRVRPGLARGLATMAGVALATAALFWAGRDGGARHA